MKCAALLEQGGRHGSHVGRVLHLQVTGMYMYSEQGHRCHRIVSDCLHRSWLLDLGDGSVTCQTVSGDLRDGPVTCQWVRDGHP